MNSTLGKLQWGQKYLFHCGEAARTCQGSSARSFRRTKFEGFARVYENVFQNRTSQFLAMNVAFTIIYSSMLCLLIYFLIDAWLVLPEPPPFPKEIDISTRIFAMLFSVPRLPSCRREDSMVGILHPLSCASHSLQSNWESLRCVRDQTTTVPQLVSIRCFSFGWLRSVDIARCACYFVDSCPFEWSQIHS